MDRHTQKNRQISDMKENFKCPKKRRSCCIQGCDNSDQLQSNHIFIDFFIEITVVIEQVYVTVKERLVTAAASRVNV